MNSKMLLAFVGGLIVASGVTYIALKRDAAPSVETTRATVPPAVAATPSTPTAVEPATAAPATPDPQTEAPAVVKEKPAKPSPAGRTQQVARAPQPARVTPPAAESPSSNPAPAAPSAPPQPEVHETAKAELPQPPPYQPPPPPKPNTVTIPSGTTVSIRLGETLNTERNQPGDSFTGALDRPLVIDGFAIAERGARAQGRIVELERSGKVRGVARLAIELTSIKTSDGQTIRIRTSAFNKEAEESKTSDAAKVGGGAALGAIIGAIAGGGKGAAIGAGAGGAAGAGGVMLTRGKPAELRVETQVSFRLSESVTVTERLQ